MHVFISQPAWEGAVDEVRARFQSSSFLRNRLAHTLLLGRPTLDLLESAQDHGRGLQGLPPTLACPSHGRRKVQSVPCPMPAPWTTLQHPPSELVPPATLDQFFLTPDLETPVAISSFAVFFWTK